MVGENGGREDELAVDPEVAGLTEGLKDKNLTRAIEPDADGAYVVTEGADLDGALEALEADGLVVSIQATGGAVGAALDGIEDVEEEE